MGLGFLSPLFLIGLLAVAIPVALHLFSRRADTVVPFSAVRFVRVAPVEQRRLRRLRDWALLALRVAALALLALAFARPYFTEARGADAPVTVLALDASASLSTPAQVERVRKLARRALEERGAGEAVGIVRFDDRASVLLAPTTDRGAARAAIARYEPGAGSTRYAAAMAAAADLIGERAGRIVVISDLQRHGWRPGEQHIVPARFALEARDVGAAASNVAVVAARREPAGLRVTVRYTGAEPRRTRVVARLAGRPVADQGLDLVPGSVQQAILPAGLPSRGVVELRVEDGAGPPADDVRYVLLDPEEASRVLVLTGRSDRDAFFLSRALAAVEGAPAALDTRPVERLAANPDELAGYTAVVLAGTSGLDRRLGERVLELLRAGGGLLVAAGPAFEPELFSAHLPQLFDVGPPRASDDPVSFTAADPRHAVFAPFGPEPALLGSVRFTRAAEVRPSPGHTVLARFTDGRPALIEAPASPGRALLFASDLGGQWNDFVRRPAFVPFAHGVMEYLAAGRGAGSDYRVGEWPGEAGLRPGVIEVPGDSGRTARRVTINVDPREADDGRLTPAAFVAAAPRAGGPGQAGAAPAAREREAAQSLWRYGLALMLLGLVAESLIGRRVHA